MANLHRLSLFSQRLDRVSYVAWFLGAIVPFGALVGVLASADDAVTSRLGAEIITLVVSAAVLSLASFITLRRMTRRALDRMDEDALRLTTLLNASTALASAASSEDAAAVTATYAARISKARAAFVVARSAHGDGFAWSASAGPEASALLAAHAGHLERLVSGVIADGRPAMRVALASSTPGEWIAPTTVAVPFCTNSGMAIAALVVVHGQDSGRFDERQLDALMTLAGLASVALTNVDLRRALSRERADTWPVLEDDRVPAGVA
jgi:K+-sensing histidine kinase KdpD